MDKEIYENYIKNFDINLLNCKFLGKGHNGIVYLLPDGKVIKICFDPESCEKEYLILKKINKNKYFPRVYCMLGNYMIRDYVDGVTLTNYIKINGLDRELSIKILNLLEEFKRLKFSKEDIRCKDIMVQPNGSLMVIDPKKFYSQKRDFPRHLSKGLDKLGVLNFFMSIVKAERPNLYKKWNEKINIYLVERQLEYARK
ncbi:protein kinase [Clostridium thailandense]|uniref:Protein kinase n=1 Tax=Clostridium thailandense TaxID=2794346 RepID=A0A949TMH8_9CLOT|nr:protein kinase [Clostridium thailandense]MBV7272007.1 protein kinase [Clostridium thailandense]MCH5136825.1 protein kinase [Clostridiaceae bacterium UIB06]